jgi:hypothetical protein
MDWMLLDNFGYIRGIFRTIKHPTVVKNIIASDCYATDWVKDWGTELKALFV